MMSQFTRQETHMNFWMIKMWHLKSFSPLLKEKEEVFISTEGLEDSCFYKAYPD